MSSNNCSEWTDLLLLLAISSAIFVLVKLFPKYQPEYLSFKYMLMGITMIYLVLWGQDGFQLDIIRMLFLACNYGAWLFFVPFINGLVSTYKQDLWLIVVFKLFFILSSQWILSNVLFYSSRFLILNTPLIPSLSEINSFLLASIMTRIVDLAVLFGILFWMNQNRELAQKRIQIAESALEHHRDKLKSLKNQLNPHFLFNTMHSIASLIHVDAKKAQDLTVKMSQLLRQMLQINELESHSLKNEWNFMQDYLAIESERFSDRLKVHMNMDNELSSQVVPTLILQPLVENAFKHGISKRTEHSVIVIEAKKEDNQTFISVVNDMAEKSSEYSTEVGLENLRARLQAFYDSNAVVICSSENQKFTAVIKIPYYE